VTFFIDVCLGTSIKQALVEMGLDVILHNDRFPQGTLDVEWMQTAAENNWLVLTRDRRINKRGIERQAIIEGLLRFFAIGSGDADLQTHILVIRRHLVTIMALSTYMPGPFFASLTKQDLKFQWLGDTKTINS
jgi:hypothetical protein